MIGIDCRSGLYTEPVKVGLAPGNPDPLGQGMVSTTDSRSRQLVLAVIIRTSTRLHLLLGNLLVGYAHQRSH